MIFNSFDFLIFFPVVVLVYFLLPYRFRWLFLLGSSCYFYMAFVPLYILILAFTIVIDYFAGIYIEKAEGKQKKLLLVISLLSNIGILCVFKYYNFLVDNINWLVEPIYKDSALPYLNILLPIGLSFHTFQAMSYTIEVYRGNQKAEKHFGIYSLYVMFFPQLVAGPIERPQNVLHQFHSNYDFNLDRTVSGLQTIIWGLFKKVVIADRLALTVNQVYNNPESFDGPSLIIATIFFAFQIYCDFSGYSDIAIGTAEIMGFRLMENFNKPYLSKSISDFWNRWHISLSSWFRDYVYIPLGGNRVSLPRWCINLMIIFLISGVWHGANWTFILWGLLQGIYITSELIINRIKEKHKIKPLRLNESIKGLLSNLTTFAFIAFAWIFFRASTVDNAFYIINHLTSNIEMVTNTLYLKTMFTKLGANDLIYGCFNITISTILISVLITLEKISGDKSFVKVMANQKKLIQTSFYMFLLFVIVILGVFENQEFIYFQF